MARQIFLTLATTSAAPPATTARSDRRDPALACRAQAVDAGPGARQRIGIVAPRARASAGGLNRLLLAANASAVREEFASSLAVAAVDGTVEHRFRDVAVGGPGAIEDRLARRRARARGLRDRSSGAASASSQSSTIRTPHARHRRSISSYSGCIATARRGIRRCSADRPALTGRPLSASHAGDRLALVERQVAANDAVDDPDRRCDPDRDRHRQSDHRDGDRPADAIPQQRPPERADQPRQVRANRSTCRARRRARCTRR